MTTAIQETTPDLAFSGWVSEWGPALWYIVEGNAQPDEANTEDFVEIVEKVRNFSIGRRPNGNLLRTRHFFHEWLNSRGSKARRRDAEDRILLEGTFLLNWKVDTLCFILDVPTVTSLRFRLFEALRRRAGLGLHETRFASRDCARSDLEYLGDRLGLDLPDPLAWGRERAVRDHVKSCARCRDLRVQLNGLVQSIAKGASPRVPSTFLAEVAEAKTLSARVGILRTFSRWPWFVRIPLQLAGVYVVVFLVLAVPYAEDIVPEWSRFRSQFARMTTMEESPKTPEVRDVNLPPPPPLPEEIRKMVDLPTGPASEGAADRNRFEDLLTLVEPASRFSGNLGQKVDAVLEAWRRPVPNVSVVETASPPPTAVEVPPAPVLPAAAPIASPVTVAASAPPAPPVASVPAPAARPPEASPPTSESAALERRFYRWGAFTGRLGRDGDAILEILQTAGAVQAGDLALGAPYRGGRYFHFSVPAEKIAEVEAQIQALKLANMTQAEATSWRKTPLNLRRVVFVLQPESANPNPEAEHEP